MVTIKQIKSVIRTSIVLLEVKCIFDSVPLQYNVQVLISRHIYCLSPGLSSLKVSESDGYTSECKNVIP